jgi:hypothetical protein
LNRDIEQARHDGVLSHSCRTDDLGEDQRIGACPDGHGNLHEEVADADANKGSHSSPRYQPDRRTKFWSGYEKQPGAHDRRE